ncbi:sel1 repeat family protein [Pseudomonas stutzeri]|uniref:tetratricopeptide repeat protein n=1 Tax=Stutzerimonas stutzeri TaxID=316 RepID=UPI000C99E5BE|nr:sel1 repeat family protein [Stutzerimonas stutzeri]MCQ4279168.1 sel1 repeat family protein [Stutzerimonas stutzeri]PNF73927.1 sel1 repeat family protein [Stutzerimonas stutzeri]
MKLNHLALLSLLLTTPATFAQTSDLSYESYVDSDKRIKCLYGYAAEKTGDHESAIKIFEDCVERWNDVYSMIWFAQMYESGAGMEVDLAKAAALVKRGAEQPDDVAYVSLARYHYGVALAEGRGIRKDLQAARVWLQSAAKGGQSEADDYLSRLDQSSASSAR